MIQMSLKQAADLLHCTPAQNNVTFHGIATDSRKVAPGMLFAALPGHTVDGHDYIPQAIERGAVATLVSRDIASAVPSLRVDDVLAALGVLAGDWRRQCPARVVGITGSNGKTTVKEMVASILRQAGKVLATQGNYNNELGLPLTIFQLNKSHDYAVLEMGASKIGDIAYLGGIARPEVGIVINVGPAHLDGFKSLQGVALGKGEMFAALPPGGAAIMNAAEPWVDTWRGLNKAGRVIYFNGEGDNHVRAIQVEDGVAVDTPLGRFSLALPLPGAHNLTNALAATAVCLALDIPLDLIKSGLEAVQPVAGRLNLRRARSGWTVIDDTYNANPASLYAALQVLASQNGEPWLVMGDMKELGSDSRKLHAELGDAARSLGVKRLFAVGEASAAAVDAFGDHAEHFDSREGLIEALRAELRPGVTCLVKGSRSMGMEHVVAAIANGQDRLEATG